MTMIVSKPAATVTAPPRFPLGRTDAPDTPSMVVMGLSVGEIYNVRPFAEILEMVNVSSFE